MWSVWCAGLGAERISFDQQSGQLVISDGRYWQRPEVSCRAFRLSGTSSFLSASHSCKGRLCYAPLACAEGLALAANPEGRRSMVALGRHITRLPCPAHAHACLCRKPVWGGGLPFRGGAAKPTALLRLLLLLLAVLSCAVLLTGDRVHLLHVASHQGQEVA